VTGEGERHAQALARHVKAALLHLRQAEDIAELAGIDVDASEHDVPEAGLIRAAGNAVEDLDLWAISNARAQGAAPADTYQHTERWCHAPGGALPGWSWPREPEPGTAKAYATTHRMLCAHADEDGQGAHWLAPGETCDRPRAADLLESDGLRQVRAYLDPVGDAGPEAGK